MTQTRFKPLTLAEMTPEQRTIAERRASGPLQRLGAPMNVLIRSPQLAACVEPLSDFLRIAPLAISNRARELVILMMARFWTAQYPWSAHGAQALKEGLSIEAVNDIAAGVSAAKRPSGLQADDAIVYDFVASVLERKGVSDAVFAAVVQRFGERGVAELIGLIGAYTTTCVATGVDNFPAVVGPVPTLKPIA